jgi:putative inorganic carbon (HCO3(-)) transporter
MIVFYFLILLMPFASPPILSRIMPGEAAFKVVGAICLLYAIAHLALRGEIPRYFRTRQARWFLALYLIAGLSSLSTVVGYGFFSSAFKIYTSFLILFFLTLSLVDSLPRFRWVLFSASAAVALGSVRVVQEWLQFRTIHATYRAGDSVGDGNYFATSAVLFLPFLFLAVLNCKTRWKRLFYACCLAVSLLGVTVCASRGGFLALAAAMLFLIARSPHRVRNLLLISAVVLPLALFLPISPLHRLLHPSRSDRNASQYRLMAWKAGARMIADHPLLGVGLGRFKPLMPQYADPGTPIDTMAHNTYIEVAAELGLPTLVVFLAIPFFSYRSLEKARQRAEVAGREFPYYAALGLQAGLVGYMVGAFFLSAEYQKLFWLSLLLSMCLPRLVRARRARPEAIPVLSATIDLAFAETEHT